MIANDFVYPEPLQRGDTIAIVSPASIVDPARVEGARVALEASGYRVRVMPHVIGEYGTFAAALPDRLADLTEALRDPKVKAILCSRGGYGCTQLLEYLEDVEFTPKWLIGYSDVSALHAFMASRGIVSIHGSMAKILAAYPTDFPANAQLYKYLTAERPGLDFPAGEYSRDGAAEGRLVGGNLAVIQALINTPYDIFAPGVVLFIEDISEPIYKVERIFTQLRLAGILNRISGLILGQFTKYQPNANYQTMQEMLRVNLYTGHYPVPEHIPVVFDAPIGHVDFNMPLLYGARVRLRAADGRCSLMYL